METTQVEGKMENRDGERGAALVMVLMISFLLLVGSAGLLLETTVNTANVTDVIAEQQAFQSAETGIQSTVNILRGNVVPNPLIDSTKAATDPANKIDFVKALRLTTANTTGDTSTVPRLSRWMTYNYAPAGVAVTEQRVAYGNATTYDPYTGNAFQVSVSDPDRTGTTNSFSTSGSIDNLGPNVPKTYGTGSNAVTITYLPVSVTDLDVSSNNAATNLGRFQISCATSSCGSITADTRFSITVTLTRPYNAVRVLRGWIIAGAVTNGSVGNVRLLFDTQVFSMMGSSITVTGVPATSSSMGTPAKSGFPMTPNAPAVSGGITTINASMTQCEPTRLTIRSVGFGPRGARKELEAIVKKNFFDGMAAPSTLTLVGSSNGFVFNLGNSNALTYSGDDVASNMFLPPIGTTNAANLSTVTAQISNKGTIIGTPSNVGTEMPAWLSSPAALDATVQNLRNVAASSGRYFTPSTTPSTIGNNATAQGITFMEGNGSLTGSGGGILVCTGTLTLSGAFNFNGMILVTGTGGITRNGGGNGTLQGATVVAPYDPAALTDNDPTNDVFLGPRYDLNGGGNSTIVYNSSSIANGMTAVSNLVQGVAEK